MDSIGYEQSSSEITSKPSNPVSRMNSIMMSPSVGEARSPLNLSRAAHVSFEDQIVELTEEGARHTLNNEFYQKDGVDSL